MDKQLRILLPGDVPIELILVEPGYFIMGHNTEEMPEDGPEHIIHMRQPFYIGKYPVTQAQWESIMKNNPSDFLGANRPVNQVSWIDIVEGRGGAQSFLFHLENYLVKERPDLSVNYIFRLPTEAEWEYSAKGGPYYSLEELRKENALNLYSEYSGGDRVETCGWFYGNSNSEPKPVGLKNPNRLGLYDMSGNLYEWCQDFYSSDTYKNRKGLLLANPSGPEGGMGRIMRGGVFWEAAAESRIAHRSRFHVGGRDNSIGFRLVLSPRSGPGTSG